MSAAPAAVPAAAALVYLVEPDERLARALRALFADHGFRVEHYRSAEELLAHPRVSAGACLVAELQLPGGSGVELLEALRGNRRPGCPVILMAERSDIATAVRAMRAGAFDFLEKPFAQSALLARVREALQSA